MGGVEEYMELADPREDQGVMWLMAHDRIMKNYSRWWRHLAPVGSFDRCTALEENTFHALRDCEDSREVWDCFVPPRVHSSFFSSQSLKDWLCMNLKLKGTWNQEERWPAAMAFICWRLWKWRCSHVFENVRPNLGQKTEVIKMG